MKKIIALLLAALLCLSFTACGGSTDEDVETVEDKVISKVQSRIMAEVALSYDTVGLPSITKYVKEMSDGNYRVTGKVTVKDKYGDSYTGTYDAMVEYNEESDSCYLDEFELGSLYKD